MRVLGSDSSLGLFWWYDATDYVMLIEYLVCILRTGNLLVMKNTWVFLRFLIILCIWSEKRRERNKFCVCAIKVAAAMIDLTSSDPLWPFWRATVHLQLKYLGFSAAGQRPKCPCSWDLGKRKEQTNGSKTYGQGTMTKKIKWNDKIKIK